MRMSKIRYHLDLADAARARQAAGLPVRKYQGVDLVAHHEARALAWILEGLTADANRTPHSKWRARWQARKRPPGWRPRWGAHLRGVPASEQPWAKAKDEK